MLGMTKTSQSGCTLQLESDLRLHLLKHSGLCRVSFQCLGFEVVKIKEVACARREVAATVEGRTYYGDYAMRLIDFVVQDH
eukprot:4861240-Amphidinium_carterae.1